MTNEIIEVMGNDESLNYCVKIDNKPVALFRSLEDASYYIEKIMKDGVQENQQFIGKIVPKFFKLLSNK